ncbi:MAG: PAS domain S-box protein, partial [bacterium]|nr:PAS domain S-box protein [bacterium]
RFRDIAENMADWIWEVDENGVYTYCSETINDILGYHADDIIGKTPFDFMQPEEAERVGKIFVKIIQKREPINGLENWNIHKNGKRVCLLTKGIPLVGKDGKLLGYRGIDSDISEQKRVQEQILSLNQLKEDLLKPLSFNEKLKRISDELVNSFEADFARIWIAKTGDRCESGCIHAKEVDGPHVCVKRDCCLHLLASAGRYTHLDGEVHQRVPYGCYKIGRIVSGIDNKFITNDVTHDQRVHNNDWAKELGLVSFAGYKLSTASGEPIGVMALFSKHAILDREDALL